MAAVSAQGPSEWDEDPAWSRPDPMTAKEREAWLDRLSPRTTTRATPRRSTGTPKPPRRRRARMSCGEELAGAAEAAADEMLALDAASTGRRGPGQAGSARVFPGNRSAGRPGSGPGWRGT